MDNSKARHIISVFDFNLFLRSRFTKSQKIVIYRHKETGRFSRQVADSANLLLVRKLPLKAFDTYQGKGLFGFDGSGLLSKSQRIGGNLRAASRAEHSQFRLPCICCTPPNTPRSPILPRYFPVLTQCSLATPRYSPIARSMPALCSL